MGLFALFVFVNFWKALLASGVVLSNYWRATYVTPDKSAMLPIIIRYGIVCVACFRRFLKNFTNIQKYISFLLIILVDIKVTPQNPKLTLFERFIWQMPAFNVNVLRSARNSLVIRTIPVSSKGFVSSHTFSMVKAKVHWPTQ